MNDNSEEVKKRNQNLIFGQLISFEFNIQTFNIHKDRVREIIIKFSEKYELNQEYIEVLLANLDKEDTDFKFPVLNDEIFKGSISQNENLENKTDINRLSGENEKKVEFYSKGIKNEKSQKINMIIKNRESHLSHHPLENQ